MLLLYESNPTPSAVVLTGTTVIRHRCVLLQVIDALSPRHGKLTTDEVVFVKDCFEALLWHLNYMEHFIQVDLINFSDVMPPLRWAIRRLAVKDIQPLIRSYSQSEGFMFTELFCCRFDPSVWPRLGTETV